MGKRNRFQDALDDWEKDMPIIKWMEKYSTVAKAALVFAAQEHFIRNLK